MSADSLPDDLNLWPHDPYELLGVEPGCDARSVRLAYTRLLRTYKPESAPEQFRRIREAYELLTDYGRYDGCSDMSYWSLGPFGPLSEEPESDESPEDSTDEAPKRHDRSATRQDRENRQALAAAWHRACDGDRKGAYQVLKEYRERHPSRGATYPMLYWLLTVDPTIDSVRSPREWLARGLLAAGWQEPLDQLYYRELTLHPREVLTARYARLMSADHGEAALPALLALRWATFGTRVGGPSQLADDLEKARTKFGEDPRRWVRLLLEAVRHLAWLCGGESGHEQFSRYRRELHTFDFLQWELQWEFEQLDMNLEVARACGRLPKTKHAARFRALFECHARQPVSLTRHLLMRWLRPLAIWPHMALRRLDKLHARSEFLAEHLLAIVASFAPPHADPSRDQVRRLQPIADALHYAMRCVPYESLRPAILGFCIRQAISPETLATAMLGESDSVTRDRVERQVQLHDDFPLRTICLALRFFWNQGKEHGWDDF
jgi:hypothetical protein